MKSRHQKALKRVMILALFIAPAIGALGYYQLTNPLKGIEHFGSVEPFVLPFEGKPGGLTNSTLASQVSVIARAPVDCKEDCQALLLRDLTELERWSGRHLPKNPEAYNFPVKFYFLSGNPPSDLPPGIQGLKAPPGVLPLKPRELNSDYAALVILDDVGEYRGYIPQSDPGRIEKTSRLLSKIVAHGSLIAYVANQTLMWERAKKPPR